MIDRDITWAALETDLPVWRAALNNLLAEAVMMLRAPAEDRRASY